MNSPKVKTQKNLSALIAIALAAVTLFSAGTANSTEPTPVKARLVESEIIAEIEQMIIEDEAALEEEIAIEEIHHDVKVFDNNDELLAEGSTINNKELRVLVNKAELVSQFAGTAYYKIVR